MKKYLFTLAAVLCCAMATTVFTACGDDDDDDKKADDNTPKKVSIDFVLYNTADMLKYCDIEMSYDNGKGKSQTIKLDESQGEKALAVQLNLSSELPATFKVTRKVTLKQDIEYPDLFEYTSAMSFKYTLYNDLDKKLGPESQGNFGSPKKTTGQLMYKINQGLLDYENTYKFNSKGELQPIS
jgi:hypothetical protein